jgi:Multiple antibiotic transporter
MDFPLKPLITLLAIINPIGVIPFYIHFTRSFDFEQRRRTIRTAAFTVFVVVATSALMGLRILEYFGITLASFQWGRPAASDERDPDAAGATGRVTGQ